jgi:N6-L-threonylcarbamoyladenine synthase
MLVLGIESSCDECAAAVVGPGPELLGQEVASQIPIHSPYGGVVPELASRDHIRKIVVVIEKTLEEAGVSLDQLGGISVTAGPGLIGSLLIGVTAAKALSWSLGVPLVGVNHLEAHLHSIFLDQRDFAYPHLGLVVSGGHTSLIRVDGIGRTRLVARTLDDAAGEAFDKVAKLLGLSYPGGVSIQNRAQSGDRQAIRFPRPMPGKRLDFSFSGLKTSACVHVKRHGLPSEDTLGDFAASFQEAIVDTLVKKTLMAARHERLERILVAGGVAANLRLREEMVRRAGEEGLQVAFPPVSLCTDNAAMVAALGACYLDAGHRDDLKLDADAGLGWHAA